MTYLESLAQAATFAVMLYTCLVAIGGAFKTVQWIGKKLNVKPFDLL